MVALATSAIIVLAIAWAAWTWWPPVLRFRLGQINGQTDRVMLDYLDGRRDLGSAARALADLWKTGASIGSRLRPAGQTVRIEDPGPGALGERIGDPRLMQLVDSAAQLSGLGWTEVRVERDST